MLNRRLSDYLFYGTLAIIGFLIILLRIAVVGGQQDRIDQLNRQNIQLQAEIDELNELVQENKYIQTSHLYDLYDTIPNVFSEELLRYKTAAMLEQLGIDESEDFNRTIDVVTEVNIGDSALASVAKNYSIVRVDISFTTDDISYITAIIDHLYNSEQLFIIDSVDYTETNGEFSQEMSVSFLAIYDTN